MEFISLSFIPHTELKIGQPQQSAVYATHTDEPPTHPANIDTIWVRRLEITNATADPKVIAQVFVFTYGYVPHLLLADIGP
jgi:hypothetical protein